MGGVFNITLIYLLAYSQEPWFEMDFALYLQHSTSWV